MVQEIELGVIIPAWKAEFLSAALESLADQRDKRFRVYVGDDQGDLKIGPIVNGFAGRLDIKYERFSTHLGGESLVRQWNRCVRLGSERWVWLFSDDDVADSGCVGQFYRTRDSTASAYDVYRFNSVSIDSNGQITRIHPPHPDQESGLEFLYHTLTHQRTSPMPEYIFSRRAFDREGGFVDFPLAWGSDHASMATFASEKGMKTIPGSVVHWRRSRINVSSMQNEAAATKKLHAVICFFRWLAQKSGLEDRGRADILLPETGLEDVKREWALRQWRSQIRWCPAEIVNALTAQFARGCGLEEKILHSITADESARQALAHYPYLSALPRFLAEKCPITAMAAERVLRCFRFVVSRRRAT